MNLSKREIRSGLGFATAEAMAAAVHNALIGPAFLTGFALAWQASDAVLGVLGAIPYLCAPFQLVGAYAADRWPQKRRLSVALFGLLARGTWLVAAALPLLCGASPARVVFVFLLLYAFHQAMYAASGPGWVAWMAVLVPTRLRGRYLGRRSLAMELLGTAALLAAGVALDRFRDHALERTGFAVLQGVAGLAGLACFMLITRQADPGHDASAPEHPLRYVLSPFRDAPFRRLFFFNLIWLAGTAFCAPFYTAHLLTNLHWSFTHLAGLGLLTSLASAVAYPYWGRGQDRWGADRILLAGALGLLFLPLLYALCPWTLRWPIALHHLLLGVFLSGFNLAFLHRTLELLPPQRRAMGAAVMAGAVGPAVFLAGAAGGWAAEQLASLRWRIGGLDIGHYQLLFLASIALHVPALGLLRMLRSGKRGAASAPPNEGPFA